MVPADTALGIAVGIGLSAAAGFRAFVPLLIMSLAARSGQVVLAPGMEWIAGEAAMVAFATATVLEVLAYYIPLLDNALDTLATPAAVVAGVVVTAAATPDLPPVLHWGVAIIAGGGIAGTIQAATVLLRLKSWFSTGGLTNPILATIELIGAVGVAVLAVLLPVVCLILVVAMLVIGLRSGRRWLRAQKTSVMEGGRDSDQAEATHPSPGRG